MTYCLGIVTKYGLVMASDSRTNAGYDQVNTVKKMHTFVQPGERVFVILTSGSLSMTQSVITLLRRGSGAGGGIGGGKGDGAPPRRCMTLREWWVIWFASLGKPIGSRWSGTGTTSTRTF